MTSSLRQHRSFLGYEKGKTAKKGEGAQIRFREGVAEIFPKIFEK